LERRLIATNRDCPARLVPTGDENTIPGSTFVTLTQSLGGNYTVIFNGNMARVDGRDADALGLPIETLEFPQSSDDTIDPSQVDQALASVYDPEIPVNIVDLGLIYSVKVVEDGVVDIQMTLTAPGCGMGPVLIEDVKTRVTAVPNVRRVNVELVFDPPWSRDRMSEEAQLELGLF
jgi:probable FeS assembly SUF system protein SufT